MMMTTKTTTTPRVAAAPSSRRSSVVSAASSSPVDAPSPSPSPPSPPSPSGGGGRRVGSVLADDGSGANGKQSAAGADKAAAALSLIDTNPPRGTRDFFPEDMRLRSWLFGRWADVARRFGFEQFDAPVLESEALFVRKAGEEISDQLYSFEDKGGRRVALRPEMTPSLARLVLSPRGKSLPMPAKWWAIAQCWRYERTTRGRRREHYQWNMDVVGVPGVEAEAELLAAMATFFADVGLTPQDVGIKVSSRRILGAVLRVNGVADAAFARACVIVDKAEKLPREQVVAELGALGVGVEAAGGILDAMACATLDELEAALLAKVGGGGGGAAGGAGGAGVATAADPDASSLGAAARNVGDGGGGDVGGGGEQQAGRTERQGEQRQGEHEAEAKARSGAEEEVRAAAADLRRLFSLVASYGLGGWLVFDASVVRGLAYYTGVVFEAFDRAGQLRAIAGGGRYDRLLGAFGGADAPCAGFGFGDAVVVELLRDRGLLPDVSRPSVDDVVFAVDEARRGDACACAARLRSGGRAVDLVLEPGKKLKAALKAAERQGAARAVLVGGKEWDERGCVVVRDMAARTQAEVKVEDLR